MILEDFIVLARTVPENSKKYGHRVCLAGWSPEMQQLYRVYPLLVHDPLRSRHSARLRVQRNTDDSRRESLQLVDAATSILSVSDTVAITTKDVFDFPRYDSIKTLNAQRLSLGLIPIDGVPSLHMQTRLDVVDAAQGLLFDEFLTDVARHGFLAGNDYDHIPYVQFKDACGWHTLQLREWGVYEYLRKHAWDGQGLAQGYQSAQHEWLALVGNMAHRRNVWLVIQLYKRRHEQGKLSL